MKTAGKRASARTRTARSTSASHAKSSRASARRLHDAAGWASSDGRPVMLGVVVVLIFATLITAGVYSGGEKKVASVDDAPVSADVELTADMREPEPAPLLRRTAVAPTPAPPTPEATLRTASLPYAPTVAPAPVEPTPVAAVVRESRPELVPEPKAETKAALQADAVEARGAQATIAGCLARDDDRYVLKNVSGDDAPKSRSWRSGFLRKRSQTVELIDPAATDRLAPYVGRQIETTGVLDDREMRVKSLRVQGACD